MLGGAVAARQRRLQSLGAVGAFLKHPTLRLVARVF
jgi:hypothetical protein